MLIVFIGPPGAGKGTQSARLADHLAVRHLSTGEILRHAVEENNIVGQEAAPYLERGDLVPDDLVVGIVAERLAQRDCQAGALMDGFPRTPGQAAAFDKHLAKTGRALDAVIELRVAREELLRRLMTRKRADDSAETISHRLEIYIRETEPILSYYKTRGVLHTIDGIGTLDQVFSRILAAVNSRAR